MTTPAAVCELASVTSSGSAPAFCASFANPKSRILMRPSFVTKTFSGFRSRWTIPFVCRGQPVRDLHSILDRFALGQRAAVQHRAQAFAFQKLGDQKRRAVVLTPRWRCSIACWSSTTISATPNRWENI
jgi:hypothetical protein